MIGIEMAQRLLQLSQRTVAGTVDGLAGEVHLGAPAFRDLPDVALAPALGTAIDRGGIDVVDTEIECPLDDGDSHRLVATSFERGLPAQAEDTHAETRPPQVARGHGARGLGICRQIRHAGGRDGTGRLREDRRRGDPSHLHEAAAAGVRLRHGDLPGRRTARLQTV